MYLKNDLIFLLRYMAAFVLLCKSSSQAYWYICLTLKIRKVGASLVEISEKLVSY